MIFVERLRAWLSGLDAGRALKAAIVVWFVYGSIIAGLVAVQPDVRTVTPEYRKASIEWWSGKPIYKRRVHGYLYFPQCAILYTPITMLPQRVGEPLWRLLGIGLLAWSLWRLCGYFGGLRRNVWFLIASAAAIPSTFSSARNGQANLHMAGLMALAAFDFGRAAWSCGVASLLLTVVLKPLGIVPCLLAGACYLRKTAWRILVGLLILAAISFVHWNSQYVIRQYELFIETMKIASQPDQPDFCDIQGLLLVLRMHLPAFVLTAVRMAAALGTLLLAILAVRRYDPARGAFVCMLLAAGYLLLFNPRTETNSYVLLAPFVGVLVASAVFHAGSAVRFAGIAGFALILSCENWGPLHHLTNLWLKAAATLVLGGFLILDIMRNSDPLWLERKN